MEYLVHRLLPKYQLHMIGGPSGAGKTTWLFQQIEEWRNGRDVLGHRSFPEPFVYVACDRSMDNLAETQARVGIQPFPLLSLIDREDIPHKLVDVINAAIEMEPAARVIFIDGFATLMDDPSKLSDYGTVAPFLINVARICKRMKITIVAVVHSAKTKEGEQFLNPRQRVLGSVAWAGFAETIVVIEPTKPEDVENQERRVMMLPRNWKESEHIYVLDDNGRLVEPTVDDDAFETRFKATKVGVNVATKDMLEWSDKHRTTVTRWIAAKVSSGQLEYVSKGVYRKPFAN